MKPQNAIVRPFDAGGRRAKLMDFGIAAVAGAQSLTATGEVVGTLAYMAPEQAEGDYAGPEADVYSLGLTLYEAWAGENPVARRTPAQTARQIGQEVPSLAELRPDLPDPLVTQIDACLEADPRNRPSLDRLHRVLDRSALELDDECAVPAPDGVELAIPRRSMPRVLALVGAGVALAALAGPAWPARRGPGRRAARDPGAGAGRQPAARPRPAGGDPTRRDRRPGRGAGRDRAAGRADAGTGDSGRAGLQRLPGGSDRRSKPALASGSPGAHRTAGSPRRARRSAR